MFKLALKNLVVISILCILVVALFASNVTNIASGSNMVEIRIPSSGQINYPSSSPSPTATPEVTPIPTSIPTSTPTYEASPPPSPTVEPTPAATPTETVAPLPTSTPVPTAEPTPEATPTETVAPLPTSTPTPTMSPITPTPTSTLTPTPTPKPTATPTPTPSPTPKPTATPTPTSTPVSGLLRASGTHIVNSNGAIFYLKGAGMDHNEWSKGYLTASDVATIKQNGGNVIELHTIDFSWDIMPTKKVINTEFFTNTLDPLVKLITGQGVYCIINLRDITVWQTTQNMANWMMDGHGYGSQPYSTTTQLQAAKDFYNLGSSVQADNRAIWISTWAWIAEHYKNNQYVMFSLVNEPMLDITFTTAERPVYGQYYATFMEQTIDAIRATGAQQLIFIDKPYCASEWSDIKRVNRANIVWEDHIYVEDNHEFAWWVNFASESVSTFVSGFGQPLFIGEYATIALNRVNWKTDMANMVAFLSDTSKFCGRSFHSWGMLYGEWDSVEGIYQALTSYSDNNYLIQTIF